MQSCYRTGLFGRALAVLAAGMTAGVALAQNWVNFTNQTATRLISADPNFTTADTQEKSLAFGDFDQDGDIDLVIARKAPFTNAGRRPNALFMNEGIAQGHSINGVLVNRTSTYIPDFLTPTDDRDIIAVDVNGDGWLDLVTAVTLGVGQPKNISHPRVYINRGNDGNGNWLGFTYDDVNRIPTFPSVPAFASVAAGDIDNDGDMDLYFTDYSSSVGSNPNYQGITPLDDRLLLNNGNGYFTDVSTQRMTTAMLDSAFGTSGAMADFNGDGAIDVIKDTALFAPQRVQIAYNNPNNPGFFNVMEVVYNNAPYFVNVGDLNNDGRPDFFVADDGTDRYALNTGNGGDGLANFVTFNFQATNGDDGFGGNAYAADLNNDGWQDVVITDVDIDIDGCTRYMHIYRNLGNAPNVTLQEQGTGGIGTANLRGTHDVAIFDIDGDGWKDMVIARCTGTFVWMNVPPQGLVFSYPQGLPAFVSPDESYNFQVQVAGVGGATPVAGSGKLFYAIGNGAFSQGTMNHLGGNLYQASLPGQPCATRIRYYVTADRTGGGTYADPSNAPTSWYTAFSAEGTIVERDEIEDSVAGWQISSDPSVTAGHWEQAIPNGTLTTTGAIAAPFEDATAGTGVRCFVTQNGPPGGAAASDDLDGGPVTLVSPVIDLSGTDGRIEFAAWFFCDDLGVTGADLLEIAVSNNNGGAWTNVMTIADTSQNWQVYSFWVSDYVSPTDAVRVRFRVSDNPNNSVTEAGIDNFTVTYIDCGTGGEPCAEDCSGDGQRDQADLAQLLSCYNSGPCCDINGDGTTDQADLAALLSQYNVPCP